MTISSDARPHLVRTTGRAASSRPPARGRRTNLSDLAYDRLEEMIVTCALPPGLFLSIQDLQAQMSFGRTPIHQAVSRLASDTLILIRPRHGLQIAPINLTRERILLGLRRDMERFVVRLATERASAAHRATLLKVASALRGTEHGMSVEVFNDWDRQVDRLLIAASGEAFLDATLRPLHTIFRRIGWIYHSRVRPNDLDGTLQGHLNIVEAVADGRVANAVAASDALMAFVDSMFGPLAVWGDPALFDCNLDIAQAS